MCVCTFACARISPRTGRECDGAKSTALLEQMALLFVAPRQGGDGLRALEPLMYTTYIYICINIICIYIYIYIAEEPLRVHEVVGVDDRGDQELAGGGGLGARAHAASQDRPQGLGFRV